MKVSVPYCYSIYVLLYLCTVVDFCSATALIQLYCSNQPTELLLK